MNKDGLARGQRYVVVTAFEANVLIHWFAPMTSGARKLLPEGLEFIVALDPPASATAVAADAEPAGLWEVRLVDERDRTAPKYGGFSISIPFEDLAAHCLRK